MAERIDPATVEGYHAHIYYDEGSRESAIDRRIFGMLPNPFGEIADRALEVDALRVIQVIEDAAADWRDLAAFKRADLRECIFRFDEAVDQRLVIALHRLFDSIIE